MRPAALDFITRPSGIDVAVITPVPDTPAAGSPSRRPLLTDRGLSLTPAIELLDMALPVGEVRSLVSRLPAGHQSGLHRTATVDLSLVLSGRITLGTETNAVELTPGDCVLVLGVAHEWCALERTVLSVTMTGTMTGTIAARRDAP